MATLKGQTVVVVGGSSGIGFSVAKASLLSMAARVIIASSNKSRVDNALSRLKSEVSDTVPDVESKLSGDVVNAKELPQVKAFMERLGEIDHLIWTCGDSVTGTELASADLEQCKGILDIRFWAFIEAARSAKIKAEGSMILTTGAIVKKPSKTFAIRAGAAGSTESLTRGLAVDLAPIRVNSVCPGLVLTEMTNKPAFQPMIEHAKNALLVKHVAYPDEVAEAYLFLMKCKYITGQRIDVDGGYELANF